MVPNDSAWKDTSRTRVLVDLWSWDGRSWFLGKFFNFEVPLLLHVWVESGCLLLECCFRGQQRFLKAMSTPRLAWDAPFDCLALSKYAHRYSSACLETHLALIFANFIFWEKDAHFKKKRPLPGIGSEKAPIGREKMPKRRPFFPKISHQK